MDSGTSRVVSALIFTAGIGAAILIGTYSEKNYATVLHENGYTKIGVIYSQQASSEAKISIHGRRVYSGSIAGAIEWLFGQVEEGQNRATTPMKKGMKVTASASIKWVASRSNFTLSLDSGTKEADGKVNFSEMVGFLEGIQYSASPSVREVSVARALVFEKNPDSGFVTTLASMLKE